MAKVIQFPSKVQINRVQRLEQLNEALDRQEQMLQEVMKELIKWHEDWIEDRQEVADQIKAVIKAKRFEKRMFATKQHGSKNELQNKLDVTESTIEFEKTRIERLESKLA